MSFGTSSSKLQTQEFGGLFGKDSPMQQIIGNKAFDTASGLSEAGGGTRFDDAIFNMATNPGAVNLGTFENALLDQAATQANQRTVVSGLGPATAGTIGSASLPVLAQLRQQQFQNLIGGQQGAQRGQQVGQQGQQAGLAAVLELAGLSMNQIVAGQKSSETSFSI